MGGNEKEHARAYRAHVSTANSALLALARRDALAGVTGTVLANHRL